jgi:hypothetical protein
MGSRRGEPDYKTDKCVFRRSVMSMVPGLWVMAMGGRAVRIATCGVTPQAQNTGTSPGAMGTASPC